MRYAFNSYGFVQAQSYLHLELKSENKQSTKQLFWWSKQMCRYVLCLLLWSTTKCGSCLTCGRGLTSDLKITRHFIPEKDLYCYDLICEMVSINILSIHLKKECTHISQVRTWEKSKSGFCEALKAKQRKTMTDLQLLLSLVKNREMFVLLWTLSLLKSHSCLYYCF